MSKLLCAVGHGNFAQAICHGIGELSNGEITCISFDEVINQVTANTNVFDVVKNIAAVIHVGSGRQLSEVIAFCTKTGIPLIQAATGMTYKLQPKAGFVCIDSPNLALPILKFMHGLHEMGFSPVKGYKITLLESHQATKKSVPGTAVKMATSLGLRLDSIISIRDPSAQMNEFRVPKEFLDGHAIHQITVEGLGVSLSFETRVYGREAYLHGILALIALFQENNNESLLATGVTSIFDILDLLWGQGNTKRRTGSAPVRFLLW